MPKIQNRVTLSEAERAELHEMIAKGHGRARELRRAQTLLLADEKQSDQDIAAFLHVNPNTVSTPRRRYCEAGLSAALTEKPRPGKERRLDGKQEALLVALACSQTPAGRDHWTMQLLADKLVELRIVDAPISDDTVRRTLKKTSSSRG